MSVERRLAVALLTAILACAAVGPRGGLPMEVIDELPPEVAPSYALFATRCSRCHTLSRPLGADVRTEAHWRMYVNRMRRNPGSGISPEDAEEILVFLRWWTEQRAAEEAAP